MYCGNCGKDLPDDANFCIKCGSPQRDKNNVQGEEHFWETCEIVYECVDGGGLLFKKAKYQFWAKAIGPTGTYAAGKSDTWESSNWDAYSNVPESSRRDIAKTHSQLVDQLVREKWEPSTNKGQHWYNVRFRRRVRK